MSTDDQRKGSGLPGEASKAARERDHDARQYWTCSPTIWT
jgi:hypothetical protein